MRHFLQIFGFVFDDFAFAEAVCSYALVFIMFYGGFGLLGALGLNIGSKAFKKKYGLSPNNMNLRR